MKGKNVRNEKSCPLLSILGQNKFESVHKYPKEMSENPKYIRPGQASEITGRSTKQLIRWSDSGKIRFEQDDEGKMRRYLYEDVVKYSKLTNKTKVIYTDSETVTEKKVRNEGYETETLLREKTGKRSKFQKLLEMIVLKQVTCVYFVEPCLEFWIHEKYLAVLGVKTKLITLKKVEVKLPRMDIIEMLDKQAKENRLK